VVLGRNLQDDLGALWQEGLNSGSRPGHVLGTLAVSGEQAPRPSGIWIEVRAVPRSALNSDDSGPDYERRFSRRRHLRRPPGRIGSARVGRTFEPDPAPPGLSGGRAPGRRGRRRDGGGAAGGA
jgi:hypothetical protein